jgi:copper chaperone CopZ
MNNRYLFFITLLILAVSCLYAQSNIKKIEIQEENKLQTSSGEKADQDTVVYEVFGMDCPGCHSAIEKQLNKSKAIYSSKADWVKQEVMIVLEKDSVLNESEVFDLIEKANFTPGKKVDK